MNVRLPQEPAAETASEADPPPFTLIEGDLASGIVLMCDHASNRVPTEYGDLGLPAPEFTRHIAYDPGVAAVTRRLAAALGAPGVLSSFSRLLIDINRGEDDPTLIMRLSDGTIVPGNAHVDAEERARRIRLYHAPYHNAVTAAIDRAIASGHTPMLVSIHSFTPVWRATPRQWHAGILSAQDRRMAEPLLDGLRADTALIVGDNEPYTGALPNDTMYRHGLMRGLPHGLVEIRQDLISDDAGAAAWADRLAAILQAIAGRPNLHEIHHFL